MSVDQQKQEVREKIWTLLEHEHAVPTGAPRRIPAFIGAALAADRLAGLPQWMAAHVIVTVPDTAQLPVRAHALDASKLVYMAVPRLAAAKPFYVLDPAVLTIPPTEAAKKEVAAEIASTVEVDDMPPVDMVVLGSVAVSRSGVRLGKGAGYSDIEIAILQEYGLIKPETLIVTTVHPLQVVDGELPQDSHDFGVDLIVTPDEVIECTAPQRPDGLIWESLPAHKIAEIPALKARQP
ncbi:5-formyltetrahydrofolate cyclo-ligase [Nocardia sp. NPDC049149]|uniref:5-formyltetrahydrofolate cyclo-ligase n=1 Tax=Nocardia sp. NPDC049149 TaxID=3364315 RepID=UPI00371733CE